jgi:dTDP-4-amino-4,6-dideoxygalactose transaminase
MISFASPAREHVALADAIEGAVLRVLRSGCYVLGQEVACFEQELAGYTGAAHAVAVSSGSDALVCALLAVGVGPGDDVIVPAFGFVAAPEAVVRVGARPVFVDIDPVHLAPDPDSVRDARASRTRAVLVMHLFGQATELTRLRDACGDLPVIEDAAQAIGTRWAQRHVGTVGEVGTLSFFPAKSLGAAGDGGALLTQREDLARRARRACAHGAERGYEWVAHGGNYRLDALQAAILRVKLAALEPRLARRRAIGCRLCATARACGAQPFDGAGACAPTFAPLALRVAERDRTVQALRARGIDARVQYPHTLPGSQAFVSANNQARFPHALRASRELLSLPCNPELHDEEVERIDQALVEVLQHA